MRVLLLTLLLLLVVCLILLWPGSEAAVDHRTLLLLRQRLWPAVVQAGCMASLTAVR
jgi:hypothetical protein